MLGGYLLILLILGFGILTFAQNNMLRNPGFEKPLAGSGWYCVNCTLQRNPDAYSGSYSAKVTNRKNAFASPSQNLQLKVGTLYYFTAYVKLQKMNPGALWHTVDMHVVPLHIKVGSLRRTKLFARAQILRKTQGWQKIGGDFYIDLIAHIAVGTTYRLYVQVNERGEKPVSFLIDKASLVAVPKNPNWKKEANARINKLRKSDVTINLRVSNRYNPRNLEIRVNQIRQSFPFGSAVTQRWMANDTAYGKKYQQIFYKHFNWAVLDYLSWFRTEFIKGDIQFPDDKAIRRLNKQGIPVRGQSVFSGHSPPPWLSDMSPGQVLSQMKRRITYLVKRYKGKLAHWDVYRGPLTSPWFENKTRNPYILNNMFKDVRAQDSKVKLFVNQGFLLGHWGSAPSHTQAFVNKVVALKAATGLVGGIAVRSDITYVPDITVLQLRLDVLATAGIPIWITELSVVTCFSCFPENQKRANAYDDLLTLYYSNPSVHGIMLVGFDDYHYPGDELFEGNNLKPNAVGKRWQEMMFKRWRTSNRFHPTKAKQSFSFRGFHGSYRIQVLNNGKEIFKTNFKLQPKRKASIAVTV